MRRAGSLLAAGVFLAAAALAQAAAARDHCATPTELVVLDAPLPRTTAKLHAHEPVTIVAIGSSSTAGSGASVPARNYPSRLAAELTQLFPNDTIEVLNKGIGGEVASDMVKRFDKDVFSERPDLVIWQVGSNDILNELDLVEYRRVVRDGVDRLRGAGLDVLIMDLQYAPKMLAHPHVAQMQQTLAEISAEEHVPVFHRFATMQHWISTGQLTFKKMLSKDGLHMNDYSYACIGRLVAQSIAERVHAPAVVSRR
jgi:lysophospholipase L1-like esterase